MMTMNSMIILMLNLSIKSTGFMCINLIMYAISITIIMSNMVKLSLMPFIIILTMMGGLIILYLYFTSSNILSKMSKDIKNNKWFMWMIMLTYSMMFIEDLEEQNIEMNSLNIPSQDFTELILLPKSNMTTILMIMTIMIMLIAMIKTCSKINSPIRRKVSK